MDVKKAYDQWAAQYDSNDNKTRDLEAAAFRTVLSNIHFDTALEIGCGTGKNTDWLASKSKEVLAIDFSEAMLNKAKAKIQTGNVVFKQADITREWTFTAKTFDLISCSLVLEHVEDLDHIFYEAAKKLAPGRLLYIGELHPFKQYSGSKARFETELGQQVVDCFNHNLSDFTHAAKKRGFAIAAIHEYFDAENRNTIPRILAILFKKI